MKRTALSIAVVLLLALAATSGAQDAIPPVGARTQCAITFSRRLAEARRAASAGVEAGGEINVPVTQENLDCLTEDTLHRVALVLRPGAASIDRLGVICYGSDRAACERTQRLIEEVQTAQRARQ